MESIELSCKNCGHCRYVNDTVDCDYYLECVDNSCHTSSEIFKCNTCKYEKGIYCTRREGCCDGNAGYEPREYILKEIVSEDILNIKEEIENNPLKPNHYNSGKYDVIWFCEHHKLDFTVGNIIKYVFRSGKKDKTKDIEDMEKAIEYCNRRIEYLKGEK